jgi:hypothetical protein
MTHIVHRARWLSLVVVGAIALAADARTVRGQESTAIGTAVTEIERLDALRSRLAATFAQSGAPAGQQAFAEVCKPVGQSMQQLGTTNGWTVRQLAMKYRNPANAPDAEAVRHMRRFAQDTSLRSVTLHTSFNGKPGVRYLRRITVESSCLACHGARDSRPAFVVSNYPKDRAFDFRAGDLRGLYSVFIPSKP